MRNLFAAWLVLVTVMLGGPARADERRVFIHEVPDAATYSAYGQVIGDQELGKFLIDLPAGEIYYFDFKLFPLHRDFVFSVLYHAQQTRAAIREYNKNYGVKKPRFVLGYLAHHLKTQAWDFYFWEGDHVDADGVRATRERLRKSFFVKDLRFRPESVSQERLLGELKDIPTITNDQIYKQVDYQAFHTGRAVGPLRIVPAGAQLDELSFRPEEIVILQESYPDITPVAGVVTATFSTPLSHVNLRARAWNIPNAGMKGAGQRYAALDHKTVLLDVRPADMILREATAAEIAAAGKERVAARSVKLPVADLATTTLQSLDGMHSADATRYGTKAANLGEIASAHLPGVDVPAGFGVPFAHYFAHLQRSGLDRVLDAMLGDRRFAADAGWRKARLTELQRRMTAVPVDPQLLDEVWARIQADLGGRSVFVRSSTNAEDLENFNGAGLYYTAVNVKGREALGEAMKAVWASLWGFRAVEERRLFGIDERAVAVGLLVQVAVNATAAGVLVTRNIYAPDNDHNYTINAQRGLGLRVVSGTTVPEQVIYDTRFPGTKIVSRSDDPTMLVLDDNGGFKEVKNPSREVILTEARARALSERVKRLRPLFHHELDVEWVLEGEKFWIVQARPFINAR